MNKSDKKVFDTLRAMYAMHSLPYYLDYVLEVGVGSVNKAWASENDNIAQWFTEQMFDHPAHGTVQADEKVMNSYVLEWSDRITNLASTYASNNPEIGEKAALYFVFCQWYARIYSLFVKWVRDQVDVGSFDEKRIAQMEHLRDLLRHELPPNKKNWDSVEAQLDDLASSWAQNSLLV